MTAIISIKVNSLDALRDAANHEYELNHKVYTVDGDNGFTNVQCDHCTVVEDSIPGYENRKSVRYADARYRLTEDSENGVFRLQGFVGEDHWAIGYGFDNGLDARRAFDRIGQAEVIITGPILRQYEVTEFESDMKRYYKGEAESFEDAAESYIEEMEFVDYDDLTRETTSPRVVVTDVATGKTKTFKE